MSVPVGARVEIALVLPDGIEVTLRGTVAHTRPPGAADPDQRAGIGVRFGAEAKADLLLLEAMAAADARQPPTLARGSGDRPAVVPRSRRSGTGDCTKAPDDAIGDVLGIDLGTSFSSVALRVGRSIVVAPDESGATQIPSVVAFSGEAPPVVGTAAKRWLVTDAHRTVTSCKRLIGRPFGDPHIAGMLHGAAYETVAGPDGSVAMRIDGCDVAATQVCAEILRYLRAVAEAHAHREFSRAVLTVPVGFGREQCSALCRAATLAGLDVVDLVPEPVAAALAYGVGKGRNEIVAVFDFGGGTFDFAVVDFSYGSHRVLATEGDDWLGGDDFDLAVARDVANAYWRDHGVELERRAVEWTRLLQASERAKRELSRRDEAHLRLADMQEGRDGVDLDHTVTRAQFDAMCRDLVERAVTRCRAALASIDLEPADVTRVVATGGMCCAPLVRRRVTELFGQPPVSSVDPAEAVVCGAALRASQIAK